MQASASAQREDDAMASMQRALLDYRRVVDLALHHQSIVVRTQARAAWERFRQQNLWLADMPPSLLARKAALDAHFLARQNETTYLSSRPPLAISTLRKTGLQDEATMLVRRPRLARWLLRLLGLRP